MSVVRSSRWWLIAVCALSLAVPVRAQEVPGGGGWSPAAGAAGDNTYEGFIDQPSDGANVSLGSSFHVSGWVVDTTADGWAGIDDVQVLNGSAVLAHGSVANSRPDVAAATGNSFWAASGFDALVPGGGLQAGPAIGHYAGRAWRRSRSRPGVPRRPAGRGRQPEPGYRDPDRQHLVARLGADEV